MEIVLLDLMSAEILDRDEPITVDAHLNGPADLA